MSRSEIPADVTKISGELNLAAPKPPAKPIRPAKVSEVSDADLELFMRQLGRM
jgi:hypothetical protein